MGQTPSNSVCDAPGAQTLFIEPLLHLLTWDVDVHCHSCQTLGFAEVPPTPLPTRLEAPAPAHAEELSTPHLASSSQQPSLGALPFGSPPPATPSLRASLTQQIEDAQQEASR